ncbi:Pyruvate, phosphate dikinase [Hartmannibacter diazotrophicus]|uniref:Pyruvate, phosphate dikinase n=1 Tax=Hartmannibacter diazotrophicus TaxID=1482074 RepID=A0A2C9DB53_9HYPH|nr:pyruvate, phosphate dikinase [Hartmannibacter diazotrophicus]SON57409.1 Pyruvate, phosphate dikinase [Hartmannibacter diazotrophicus]
MTKWVYRFGNGMAEGTRDMRDLLGGKGANLAEMSAIGLPVPPGFTISTAVCTHFYEHDCRFPDGLRQDVAKALAETGSIVGKSFGDPDDPLLVSVRSGARASMPGMMDTVLNLGLNDIAVEAVARASGDARFAYDSYRRFISMYAEVVLGLEHGAFEDILHDCKTRLGRLADTDLRAEDWLAVIAAYKSHVLDVLHRPFPDDPMEQLWGAIGAVFSSWMNERAITYRSLHGIPASWGTAVNVQAMVFGNRGETSATGVAFTRNPSTGENAFFGEYLVNAQGEDVVAGIRTPQPLTATASDPSTMEAVMPDAFRELSAISTRLEQHYRDMQDIEFTVEDGKLWMLQTRSGKRTTHAAVRIAVEMAREGLISRADAVRRIEPASLDQLLHPSIDPAAEKIEVARGLPASPGAACGEIAFSAEEAEVARMAGRDVILVRQETSPEDIKGMLAANGILTRLGGMTSHAAVVARGWGKTCVSGASGLEIDAKAGRMTVGGRVFLRGETITIDGSSGRVYAGKVAMRQPVLSEDFATLMQWADAVRRMKVRANAETPEDARQARAFGAEGIGLCRTEHMFFDEARIASVRAMILADDETGRRAALARLLEMQRSDFQQLFEIMDGLPVTIRLLDPPLHEFLPHGEAEIEALAAAMEMPVERLRARALELGEHNPMLGFRGCRLAIAFPEIAEMQARAVFEGALAAETTTGRPVVPEIMVPLVTTRAEFDVVRGVIDATAETVMAQTGRRIVYQVGTMIELPRAALRAGEIAETAEFFSFGTNDLTQTALGISRDDAGRFLRLYVDKGIYLADPFVTIDQEGIGELVDLAILRARKRRPDIKLGICGEHGGDPASIDFFDQVGLDYVSCSPFRVPAARLAAAQASLARQESRAGRDEATAGEDATVRNLLPSSLSAEPLATTAGATRS